MTLTPLARANFLSRALADAQTYRLNDAGDARAFIEREIEIFAHEEHLSTTDTLALKDSVPQSWLADGEAFNERLRTGALEALAHHFGHKSFKDMVRSVGKGVSAALDASGWINTNAMGPALLELCYSYSDWNIYERLRIEVPEKTTLSRGVAEAIHGSLTLELEVQRQDASDGWKIALPPDGGRHGYSAFRFAKSPPGVMSLSFGTGSVAAFVSHHAHYRKEGDAWVPLAPSPEFPSFGPETIEYRAFEALERRVELEGGR